ncbi:MAG: hypothetical protein NC342_07965 [Pseudoflavonifractor sp.]|nr:hypothetical protein [Alloprevotella sp.]MCM1117456.1 hypothetical protein [Pseudoflavonifractor sp.]
MANKLIPGSQSTPPSKVAGWKGYTLNELRYRQAYVAARLELEKEQLIRDMETERSMMTPMGLLGNLGSMMQYANWGILAFQALKTVGSLFRHKK